MKSLFEPIRIGSIEAKNRIFMAAMTRARGTRDHHPTAMMADYYAQRASAGLIISEAIGITQEGLGWPFATGIWNKEQIEGWSKITSRVHERGGKIIAQLWHMGRTVHPSFLSGAQPISASVTTAPGYAHTYAGKVPYQPARALELSEIPRVLIDFESAARNAVKAGFDGVQIHAANGYLIDQFLRDGSNFRTDRYGGTIENRIRFLKEVTSIVAYEIGEDKTGVRLSPNVSDQGVQDSQPEELFHAAIETLSQIGIAHLELREPPVDGTFGRGDRAPFLERFRGNFKGVVIANSDYDQARAQKVLDAGLANAVAFGRPFIANPDLPERFARSLSLTPEDRSTWFTQGENGYTDYLPTEKRN